MGLSIAPKEAPSAPPSRRSSEVEAAAQPTSVELFAGGGGMVLGTEAAGWRHLALSELDRRACETLSRNGAMRVPSPAAALEAVDGGPQDDVRGAAVNIGWPLLEGDCRRLDWTGLCGRVDLLAGGPP